MGAGVDRNRGSAASLTVRAVIGSTHKKPWESNPPIRSRTVVVHFVQSLHRSVAYYKYCKGVGEFN